MRNEVADINKLASKTRAMIAIPDIFRNSDTIYHYTKASTAVEHIFYKERLRFSAFGNSIDTIEKSRFDTGLMYSGTEEERFQKIYKNHLSDANSIEEKIHSLFDSSKIICFCENDLQNDYYLELNRFKKDFYGFLKPRMWDQYGENYKGICLAFSKEKLVKVSENVVAKNIEYIEYDDFDLNFSHINLNSINNVGPETYYNNVHQTIIDFFFKKHKDYKDENEFRLLKSLDNDQFLDISESICGIIVSPELIESQFILDQIKKYSREKQIELLYLLWNKNGVTITSRSFFDEVESAGNRR